MMMGLYEDTHIFKDVLVWYPNHHFHQTLILLQSRGGALKNICDKYNKENTESLKEIQITHSSCSAVHVSFVYIIYLYIQYIL